MKTLSRMVSAGLFVLGLALNSGVASAEENGVIVHFSIEGAYEDVLFDLNQALINEGLVKNYTAHVAEMLQRTAADVGATKMIYKNGDVLEFCSATLSRAAMEADPMNIAVCPYSMFAYETADNPGTVVVGYRKVIGARSAASKAALADVNALLARMVETVVEAY